MELKPVVFPSVFLNCWDLPVLLPVSMIYSFPSPIVSYGMITSLFTYPFCCQWAGEWLLVWGSYKSGMFCWYVLVTPLRTHVSILSGSAPRNGPGGPQDVCVPCGRSCRTDFPSNCMVLLPTNDLGDLCFLYFLHSTCCCWFCCSQSLGHVWQEVSLRLWLIFPAGRWGRAPLLCSLDVLAVFPLMPAQAFAHF